MLYGVENIGINFHLVTHMVQSTLDCGCAWTYSTFIPESVNRDLMNLTQGSQAVVEQMDLNYLMKLKLEKMFLNFKNKAWLFLLR